MYTELRCPYCGCDDDLELLDVSTSPGGLFVKELIICRKCNKWFSRWV
jgi:uncharacterized protein YbaR (Trm112 family)